jgi:hypothetical protein
MVPMDLAEALKYLIDSAPSSGNYPLDQLGRDGIGLSSRDNGRFFLLFLNGEPKGAVFVDDKGVLYGDKAVLLLRGSETFSLHDASSDSIARYTSVSRIFDERHLQHLFTKTIPCIAKKPEALGVLSLRIVRDGIPQAGFHVSVRKNGMMVGNAMTHNDGFVSFRLFHGEYECALMDENHQIRKAQIQFDKQDNYLTIEIGHNDSAK